MWFSLKFTYFTVCLYSLPEKNSCPYPTRRFGFWRGQPGGSQTDYSYDEEEEALLANGGHGHSGGGGRSGSLRKTRSAESVLLGMQRPRIVVEAAGGDRASNGSNGSGGAAELKGEDSAKDDRIDQSAGKHYVMIEGGF